MTQDNNKNITNISYNHLNLPLKITFGSGNDYITYTYDASGVKVKKQVKENNTVSITDYLDGYQYNNNTLLYFPHAEGYVDFTEINTNDGEYRYVYQYKDHLGNIRLSYADNNNDGYISVPTEILVENNYYPFGLEHATYNTTKKEFRKGQGGGNDHVIIRPVANEKYSYKYNGKELEEELGLGWYDYQARRYDPALGRWHVVDPMAHLREWVSPYNFVQNNPINRVDPTGALDDWVQDADGNISWDANVTSADDVDLAEGSTYLGRDLTFTFNSYIDGNLWDGPMGSFPAGDKLTSTISLTSNTDADNNLLSVDIKSNYDVHKTGGIFQGLNYFPGQTNTALDIKGATGGTTSFEQHAMVNGFEEMGLGLMGYDAVNVAQKLTLGLSGNQLSVTGATDVFPSATLGVNGIQLFQYNQPSFRATHGRVPDYDNIRIPRNPMDDGIIIPTKSVRPSPSFYKR